MGHCLVLYDIPHDRTRTKIADICLDYGLDRIQYSAFVGKLVRTHQEELMRRLKRQLGKRAGNIQLYPICQKDWAEHRVIDVAPGEERDGEKQEEHGPKGGEPDETDIPF